MTEPSHTPGPWRASFFAGKWMVLHKGDDDTTIVAEPFYGKADARLIASAPDMLGTLQDVAEYLDNLADVDTDDGGRPVPNKAMRLFQEVTSLITKAGVAS